jgi:hypothetical protein
VTDDTAPDPIRFFADGEHDDGPALQRHLDAGGNLDTLAPGRYLIGTQVQVREPLMPGPGTTITGLHDPERMLIEVS